MCGMATYLSLHYHLVFSTKNRAPLIAESWLTRLHEYLGGTVNGLGGFIQQVGGINDHVHLLVGLKATHCLADFIRELKRRHPRGCMRKSENLSLVGRTTTRHSQSARVPVMP